MIERACKARKPVSVGAARQRGRNASRARAARRAPDVRHRPDLGARSGQRLPAGRLDARRVGGAARDAIRRRSRSAAKHSMAEHVRAMLDFHARACRRVDYGNNIRQMALEEGVDGRLRLSRLRAGLHPPAVLPRHRAVPLGCAVRRSRGHLQDRRQGEGAAPGQHAPAPLARHGAGAHRVPGAAGAHLLGRPRRPPSPRARLQRDGGAAAS